MTSEVACTASLLRALLATVVALLLAACTRAPVPDADQAAVPTAPGPVAQDQSAAVQDGLQPLDEHDIAQAQLSGELGCGFSSGGTGPLLYASGVVASDTPALAVMRLQGRVRPLRSPGGFSGLLDSPLFEGDGLHVEISQKGPAQGGGESPPVPATLTWDGGDGARGSLEGEWQCGP